MRKILEVLQYGENDIRFKTDFDCRKNQREIIDLIPSITYSMLTSLWGGIETTVLGIIRMLAVADLGLSVNRKEMVQFLDRESKNLAAIVQDANCEMQKKGHAVVFPAGVGPSKIRS